MALPDSMRNRISPCRGQDCKVISNLPSWYRRRWHQHRRNYSWMRTDRVIAKTKSPTTADVTTGIVNALQAVLTASQLSPQTIGYAMLGTTHCTNAIVTRRGLESLSGLSVLGAPATSCSGTACSHGHHDLRQTSLRTEFRSPRWPRVQW